MFKLHGLFSAKSELIFSGWATHRGYSSRGQVLLDGLDLAEGRILHQLLQLIWVDGLSLMRLLVAHAQSGLMLA